MEELKRDLKKYRGDERPVLLCFTTDPYQPLDVTAQLARHTIVALADNGNAVRILTKGGMRAARDFDVMASCDCEFGATLTFMDDARSAEWEPAAAAPTDRIAALRAAKSNGIRTWASLEPVIDTEEVYKIIRATHEFVDLYKVGKLNYHPRAKAIDWHRFRIDVESLLAFLGKDFYIKDDLRKF
jgi:DNA repair photolyase